MNPREFESHISQLLAGGQEVLKRLRSALDLSSTHDVDFIFYTRSRVKKSDSIRQKIRDRQVRYGADYSLADITDIVGLRVVVLYDEYLVEAANWVISALESTRYSRNPLLDGNNIHESLSEATAFRRRNSKNDPYEKCLREVKDALRLDKSICVFKDADESHYSSLHLLLSLKSYSLGEAISVPVEIQVRTAIEDVWGEISHKSEYKARPANIWSPGIESKLLMTRSALSAFKASIDGGLPETISQIRSASNELDTEIEKCKTLPRMKSGSVVIDQIYEIEVGPMAEFSDALSKYRQCLVELPKPAPSNAKIKILQRCIEICGVLQTEMDANPGKHKTGLGLMEFEALRIKTLLIRFESDRISDYAEDYTTRSEPLLERAREIYDEMTLLDRRLDIRLKSKTLFQYWLFYSARYAGLEDHSARHLEAAEAELASDIALPEDSIVRSTTLRALALRYWKSASREAVMFGYNPNGAVTALREYIASQFSLALAYEVRSSRLEMDENRSDLIYSQPPSIIGINNKVLFASDCQRWHIGTEVFGGTGYTEAEWLLDIANLEAHCGDVSSQQTRAMLHTLMMAYVAQKNHQRALKMLEMLPPVETEGSWRRSGLLKRYEADKALVKELAQ